MKHAHQTSPAGIVRDTLRARGYEVSEDDVDAVFAGLKTHQYDVVSKGQMAMARAGAVRNAADDLMKAAIRLERG